MISLNQGAQPQILVDNGEDWTAEYVNWNQNRVGTEPDRYRHPQIRSALEAETHAKCAYCEGLINDVAYTNIEHKLPKKKHPTLVCAWQNLTIACPRCNINKGEYDEPDCPLLDPYTDNVEYEVAFAGPLALPRGGPRAHVTISVLDLNRTDLFLRRKPALEYLHRLLGLVERAANQPAALRALWLDIDAITAAAGEFASACRQFLTAQMAERGLARP
jgi:5-methylcytosine-specific restriction endonuclease McrA